MVSSLFDSRGRVFRREFPSPLIQTFHLRIRIVPDCLGQSDLFTRSWSIHEDGQQEIETSYWVFLTYFLNVPLLSVKRSTPKHSVNVTHCWSPIPCYMWSLRGIETWTRKHFASLGDHRSLDWTFSWQSLFFTLQDPIHTRILTLELAISAYPAVPFSACYIDYQKVHWLLRSPAYVEIFWPTHGSSATSQYSTAWDEDWVGLFSGIIPDDCLDSIGHR